VRYPSAEVGIGSIATASRGPASIKLTRYRPITDSGGRASDSDRCLERLDAITIFRGRSLRAQGGGLSYLRPQPEGRLTSDMSPNMGHHSSPLIAFAMALLALSRHRTQNP
jgi:hypothetical protein